MNGKDQGHNIVSRRIRTFVEEQSTMNPGHAAQISESRSSSADEVEKNVTKRDSRTAVSFRPTVVDLGMDISSIFPSTLEDKQKQVVKALQDARASTKAKIDGRPINFGVVLPGVYRSSFPSGEDFAYLGTLGLKTILSLVKKGFSPEFLVFMKHNGIRHHVIDMQGTKKAGIPEAIMHEIMEVVLNQENHPVLIHCNQGKHRTGCAVAVMRHVAGWNVDSVIEEYRGYAEPKIREWAHHTSALVKT